MVTIETGGTVSEDGRLTVQLRVPTNVQPGKHRVVVVIDEEPVKAAKRPPLDFPVDDCGPWPADLSLRREDMYDDRVR